MISIGDFKKIEIKTATVLDVKEHPDADKLYLVRVGTGDGERVLVAGIKPYYSPDELIGKQVLVVTNLEPARIRGELSEGMLLASSDGENLSIAVTDKKVKDGSPVS
jgi:methionyl-tRNA synthetase